MFFTRTVIFSNEIKKPIFHIGGEVDLGVNVHFADFNKLQNIPNCCPRYTNTFGLGWNLSLFAHKELSDEFALRLKGGLNTESVTFKENEFIGNTPVKYEEDVSQIVLSPVTVKHYLVPKLIGLYFEPVLMFRILEKLWLNFGLNVSNLVLAKLDQKEVLVSPSSVVFVNGEKERNVYLNLDIPNVNKFLIRPSFGVSYDLELFKSTWISPQLRFLVPLQNLANENWKISHLDFGISARFPIYPPPEVHYYYDTILVRDTFRIAVLGLKSERTYLEETVFEKTIKEKVSNGYIYKTYVREKYRTEVPRISQLETKLNVVGKSKQGEVQNNPILVIEEFETEEMFPLLPYIYFPTGEWRLESTSVNLIDKSTIDSFDEGLLPWNTLKIYENLLNIIGKRLKQNQKESIVLIGCNSNTGVELNNLELSKKRALAVKEYLVDVWGIEPERINVKFRNLPEKMTNPSIPEGIEENQRVEIFSTSAVITAPVRLSQIEKVVNPPYVEILPEVHSDASLKGWNLTIEQSGSNLRTFAGSDMPEKLTWNVEEEPIPKLEEPISVNF
ncbi:MAG: OmpA family protein, partial [Candidatus Kapaibacteriota bacterium]